MITQLGNVRLRTGEKMIVKCIEPPEERYREKLMRFLEHKDDLWMRDISERLKGNYSEFCIDRYFIEEIGENVISQMWYGISKKTKMGNFGHVYTEPEYRKKGITNELMKFFLDDFQRSKGKALFCGTGSPWIADIYKKYGFQLIKKDTDCGPMVLIKPEYAKDFKELEDEYFQPGLSVNARIGNIGDQFDCDKVLAYSTGLEKLSQNWHQVFLTSQISTFMQALFKVEDGKGLVTVAESTKGSIVGYAFILALGSLMEDGAKTLDFIIHPNYINDAVRFVEETIKIRQKEKIENIRCYVCSGDKEKLSILLEAGFKEEAGLSDYCFLGNSYFDLKMLVYI
ncbi:GNAT family N-acetyltransferase [bacterium]|nr:GNAT family N-acetyltransferase [bacterium]